MDRRRVGGLPNISCRNCGVVMALDVAIVHMAAADLFVCPLCSHQDVWRKAVEPITPPEGVLAHGVFR
jgi:predicted RNA-binding Zn-ribbon protein involved in translation (DUF1610 family)